MGTSDVAGELLAGKYRLERPLARGASAVVWQASHVLTGRTVAVKLFDAPGASHARSRERWLREARAASRVRHPNLLPIDDVIELDDGRAALIMERLVGRSLRDQIASGPLDAGEVVALFAPVVEALGQAHAAGIVHRDLKPDNLFVTDDPRRLVVLDFGVAKLASDGELGLTSTGATVGTPFYMAPEQLFGEDDVDGRADAWALGVVLHECLTGRRPIEAANLGQLLKRIHEGSLPPLDPAVAPAHPALVALVSRLLTVERSGRASLDDAREALSPGASRTARAAAETTEDDSRAVSGSSGQKPARWAALALGAVVAAGVALGVGWPARTDAGSAGSGASGAGGQAVTAEAGRGGALGRGAEESPAGAPGSGGASGGLASGGLTVSVGSASGAAGKGGTSGTGVKAGSGGRAGEAGSRGREAPGVVTRASPAVTPPHIVEDIPF